MGKKNQQKRKQQEIAESILGAKGQIKPKIIKKKKETDTPLILTKRELESLEKEIHNSSTTAKSKSKSKSKFGKSIPEDDNDEETWGNSYNFDAQGNLIVQEEEGNGGASEETSLQLLGNTITKGMIELGKNFTKKGNGKSSKNKMSQLLGLIGGRKKEKAVVKKTEEEEQEEEEIEEEEENIDGEIEHENKIKGGNKGDDVVDEENDNEEIEEEGSDIDSEEEEKEDMHVKKYGESHYNEEEMNKKIEKIKNRSYNNLVVKKQEHQYWVNLATTEENYNQESIESQMKWELKDYFIKNRLIEPFEKLNLKNGEDKELNDSQKEIFSLLNNYYDLFYPILNLNKTNEIRNAYMLHALNHIFKVRDTILKNNFKIAKAKSQNKEIENIKDSGFTRAKVLILVPFKSVALDIVNKLCDLSGCDQIQNKAKFLNEYQLPKGTIDPVKNNTKLPEDHRQIFSGNTEDYFKLGIKLTRKTLKLYTSFYQSDIILASPLALRLGTEQKEYDFLSSIEIVILDQLDHLCMQNSEHLHHLFSKLNQVPTEARDVDFSRVKSHYLNQQAEFNCQLITLSQIITPEIQALFHKYSKNVEGKIQYFEPVLEGQYLKIENPVSHKLFRILSNGQLTQQDELRFEYFKNNILPQLNQKLQFEKKVMLFINNYFDFVKVKNYLKLLNFEFGTISEYSSIKEVSKYRNWLKIGKINLILYTERCHFYRRYKIQDINEIIFYSLPDYCNYYNELIDNIQLDSLNNKINITILFSKWDELKLNGIFGTKNTRSFIHGNRDQINF